MWGKKGITGKSRRTEQNTKIYFVFYWLIIIIHNKGSIFQQKVNGNSCNRTTRADHLFKMNPFILNAARMQTFFTVMPFKILMRSNKCCMEAMFLL